jgi:hypothetical protein
MGPTSGAGTVYPFGTSKFTPVVSGVPVTRSLVLRVCIVDRCLSFCPFLLVIVFSVLLRFTVIVSRNINHINITDYIISAVYKLSIN